MQIITLKVGTLECNCYILKIDKYALVIDPGSEFKKIDKYLQGVELKGILITHHHFDHIGALQDLIDKYHVKVYDYNNLSNKEYTISPFTFDIIYNPGHTTDSISFYFKKEKIMFVGDFIFADSIGRTDLETGNMKDMQKSLSNIKKIDNNIILYPGHGPTTNLDYEKKHNIYFR